MRILQLGIVAASLAVGQITIGSGVSINAQSYGCVGDGTTDNTTCLTNIQTALIAAGGGNVFFPPGTYVATKGYWIQGIRNAHFYMDGVTFKNTFTSGQLYDLQLNCDYWGVSGDPNNGFDTAQPGTFFQSASAGAISITLVTAAQYNRFTVGHYIFLAGYDQQGSGYPPNVRYSETHKITAIDSGTGVITLDGQLKYSYDSRWNNTLSGVINVGAPAAIDLQHTGAGACSIAENIVIDGLTVANNPNGGDLGYPDLGLGSMITEGTLNFVCNRCRIGHLNVSESEKVTLNDTYAHLLLLDKVVDNFVCNRCTIDRVADGTGVRSAIFRDSVLRGCSTETEPLAGIIVQAKYVEISGSQIFCNPGVANGAFIQTSGGSGLNYSTVLRGNTFYLQAGTVNDTGLLAPPFKGQLTALSAPTGSSITAAVDTTYILPGLDIGSVMFTASHAKVAIVTAIYYNGSNLTIEGTWTTGSPATNDVYFFMEGWSATILGNVAPYQGTNRILDIYLGQGATAAQAAYMQSINSDFNRVSKVDPGCETSSFPKGYPGKQWIDISNEAATAYKVCMYVSGSLTWVTVKP